MRLKTFAWRTKKEFLSKLPLDQMFENQVPLHNN